MSHDSHKAKYDPWQTNKNLMKGQFGQQINCKSILESDSSEARESNIIILICFSEQLFFFHFKWVSHPYFNTFLIQVCHIIKLSNNKIRG